MGCLTSETRVSSCSVYDALRLAVLRAYATRGFRAGLAATGGCGFDGTKDRSYFRGVIFGLLWLCLGGNPAIDPRIALRS